jgi:phosphatidylserine/phosphatidylglycerophosphate/cardiolipin synthase-like enzyme
MSAGQMAGLTTLSDVELETIARAVRQGLTPSPLTASALAELSVGDRAGWLVGLDTEAVLAAIIAVLAERRRGEDTKVDLVWTGPDVAASAARDTAVVVRELFARAERSALVAGFSFDHGADIFEPLHRAMRDRAVEASIFLDLHRAPRTEPDVNAHVRREIDTFLIANWPFGAPIPRLYYDPRTAEPTSTASLHAKCIVVDDRRALVTSANFTSRGQERNVEVGVLVESEKFARELVHQWRNAAEAGVFRQVVDT